jgi:hypothetical protein
MTMTARTYMCPLCSYDGFTITDLKATADFNVQPGCPRCMTVDGIVVLLEETSDPRDEDAP